MSVVIRNMSKKDPKMCQLGAVLGTTGVLAQEIGEENLKSEIQTLKVRRFGATKDDNHWEMFWEGPKTSVKVDLMKDGYRILYGATVPAPKEYPTDEGLTDAATVEPVMINPAVTLVSLVEALVQVATAKGDWTGTAQYNCQDFVVAFLQKLGMRSTALKYELWRFVTKNFADRRQWLDVESVRQVYGSAPPDYIPPDKKIGWNK